MRKPKTLEQILRVFPFQVTICTARVKGRTKYEISVPGAHVVYEDPKRKTVRLSTTGTSLLRAARKFYGILAGSSYIALRQVNWGQQPGRFPIYHLGTSGRLEFDGVKAGYEMRDWKPGETAAAARKG